MITYFLLNPSARTVKIGRSTNLPERHRALEHASGARLTLIGKIDGDQERAWHDRFASCRLHGEWFLLTEPLAQALRDLFGVRLSVPRATVPRPPRLSLPDFRHDLESRSGLGLRSPDLAELEEYLTELALDLRARAFEDDEQDDDEHVDWPDGIDAIVHAVSQWEALWLGWMAPPVTPDGLIDVWLAFWLPGGEHTARRLRTSMLRAAVAADGDDLEFLRLRPILVDRRTAAVEDLPPDELYGDLGAAVDAGLIVLAP